MDEFNQDNKKQKKVATDETNTIEALPSIDDLCEQFKAFRLRKDAETLNEIEIEEQLNVDHEVEEVLNDFVILRKYIGSLKTNVEGIVTENLPDLPSTDISSTSTLTETISLKKSPKRDQNKSVKLQNNCISNDIEKSLVITCSSTVCVFENCNRRVDSQLMLIHYLSDHCDKSRYGEYYELAEGQHVVLSFQPKYLEFRHNQVLGLLTYSGTIEEKFLNVKTNVIYNSFLPDKYQHLESHVPIIVMICKTAMCSMLKDKGLVQRIPREDDVDNHIYVIWLVSPNNEKQLNATIAIYGRDPGQTLGTTIAVRYVCETQNTSKFMPIDSNYLRLSYKEIKELSNDFRDFLYLEIHLTESEQYQQEQTIANL